MVYLSRIPLLDGRAYFGPRAGQRDVFDARGADVWHNLIISSISYVRQPSNSRLGLDGLRKLRWDSIVSNGGRIWIRTFIQHSKLAGFSLYALRWSFPGSWNLGLVCRKVHNRWGHVHYRDLFLYLCVLVQCAHNGYVIGQSAEAGSFGATMSTLFDLNNPSIAAAWISVLSAIFGAFIGWASHYRIRRESTHEAGLRAQIEGWISFCDQLREQLHTQGEECAQRIKLLEERIALCEADRAALWRNINRRGE